jgi:hypothetical protein
MWVVGNMVLASHKPHLWKVGNAAGRTLDEGPYRLTLLGVIAASLPLAQLVINHRNGGFGLMGEIGTQRFAVEAEEGEKWVLGLRTG